MHVLSSRNHYISANSPTFLVLRTSNGSELGFGEVDESLMFGKTIKSKFGVPDKIINIPGFDVFVYSCDIINGCQ